MANDASSTYSRHCGDGLDCPGARLITDRLRSTAARRSPPIAMVDDSFSALGVLLTLYAAFTRVLPPLFRYPLPPVSDLYDLYIGFNPFVTHFCLYLLAIPLHLVLALPSSSALTLTDRLFPLNPPLTALMYALHAPLSSDRRTALLPDARLALLAAITLLWATQALRTSLAAGAYAYAAEDARYTALRARLGVAPFALLSLTLSLLTLTSQSFLTSPLSFVWTHRAPPAPLPLSPTDYVLFTLLLLALVTKETAHRQAAAFHARHPDKAFVTTGLHAWLRQPAVLAELAFWWAYFAFAAVEASALAIWPAVGPLSYTCIACAWTAFSERELAGDAEYAQFQKEVWCFLPTPPKRPVVAQGKKVN